MRSPILARLYAILIEPPAVIKDVARRYQSRLLNVFLLSFMIAFAGVDTTFLLTKPGYSPPWYGYVFLMTAYLLNRRGQYGIASTLTISMFPIVIFANIASGRAGSPLTTLYYLIPGLIFASILLSIRFAMAFALVGLILIAAIPSVAPDSFVGFPSIVGPLTALVISCILVLISMWSRDQIEKERQAEVRDSAERLQLALDAAQMGTWSWDLESGRVSWSDQIVPMFGLNPGDFDGKYETYLSLIHPEDLSRVQDTVQRVLANPEADFMIEHRLVRPSGEVCWLEGRGKVHRNTSGKPIRMTGTVVDITERKRSEEALRQAEEKYRSIVEYAVYGIYQSSPDGRFVSANTAMARIYGYDTSEEMLRSITDIASQVYVDAADRNEFSRILLTEGAVYGFEARNRKKDGSIIWISSNARAVKDQQGQLLYYEGTVEDITDRKNASAERERLLDELSAKNAELERFVYTVSHDLKAPLVTIVGFLGYLEEDLKSGDRDAFHKDMDRIYRATFKMQDLLQDLLDLSRIGRMMNEPASIPFDMLVTEAVELTHGRLQERGVQVNIQPGMPHVYGDVKRLLELVQNLIDNAAKYMGEQAEPVIEIGCDGRDNGMSVLFIRDNGMGIAPEHHERIFGLFNKLDPNIEGTGVGLALVKRIVEFHGGKIWVKSDVGQGATFFFTLPLPKDDNSPKTA